jgi:hypothetical protein
MPFYYISGSLTASAAFNQHGSLAYATSTNGSALRRGRVYELLMGAASAPAATDTPIAYDLSRITTSTSGGTSYAPQCTDPAELQTPSALGYITASGATVTANSTVFDVVLNQRNSQRWTAAQESQMLIWPATSGNGFAFRALSPAYAASVKTGLYFQE